MEALPVRRLRSPEVGAEGRRARGLGSGERHVRVL